MGKHLVIVSYDGIATHYCGVGQTVQDTVSILGKILPQRKVKVSLAYIFANPIGSVFDKKSFRESAALTKKTGGYLIPLNNGTPGLTESDMWQSFPQWEFACASLATALDFILEDEDDNVVMLHDTPFLLFHKFKEKLLRKNSSFYYMPRSSGLNYRFGEKLWRQERIRLEREAFQAIEKDPDSAILAIGRNFARHLSGDYHLRIKKNNFLPNGLYFRRYKKFLSEKLENATLRKFGIDIDRKSKIIFSWGRASEAKGMRELLEAWRRMAKAMPQHHLIIQAPNNSGEARYFQNLKKLERVIPRTTVIDDFNPKIWQTCLRVKNTDIVCIPSTMDPNPHTPIEAKLFLRGMKYVIVCSNLDGVKDTFSKKECLWVNPLDTEDFSRTLLRAARLNQRQRSNIARENGNSLADYDYVHTIRTFLKQIRFL